MASFLIIYGTREGQTEKIAGRIAAHLRALKHHTHVLDAKNPNVQLAAKDYDGVIVGAPIHAGRYPAEISAWIAKNREALENRPSAFYSVCLGILEKDNMKTQTTIQEIVHGFLRRLSWAPSQSAIFAGSLAYSKYGWFKRLIMKRIAKKAGGATDTRRDYEYTDWKDVETFALGFAKAFPAQTIRVVSSPKWNDSALIERNVNG